MRVRVPPHSSGSLRSSSGSRRPSRKNFIALRGRVSLGRAWKADWLSVLFLFFFFLILHRQCLLLLLLPVLRVNLSYHPSLLDTRLPYPWGLEIMRMKLASYSWQSTEQPPLFWRQGLAICCSTHVGLWRQVSKTENARSSPGRRDGSQQWRTELLSVPFS